ncbi:MAG: phosphatidylserine decarboxylase family protein [Verrucomicrobiae bacterium]|nr:phosphatidylserine decarboxylase family protein [Verrucomicrobiae bacterium]
MKTNSRVLTAARCVIGRALIWLLLFLAGAVVAWWLKSSLAVVVFAATGVWILFSLFTLFFFRDPDPHVPAAPEAVVAPAHGQVDCVEESTELEFLGSACRRISIFLSVFDVHVQNAPVAGKVAFLQYQPGRFLSALKTESATFNENLLIGIESSEQPGERIAVRQIAGALARRVVAWVKTGEQVARGQRLGLIQYGSRCDLYLPLSAIPTVQPGDKVVGGETVVARRADKPSISMQKVSIQ